jgi:hypothetical protein
VKFPECSSMFFVFPVNSICGFSLCFLARPLGAERLSLSSPSPSPSPCSSGVLGYVPGLSYHRYQITDHRL